MLSNNPDGLVLLIVVVLIVVGTLIWNAATPKKYRLTFDNAERVVIFSLAAVLILIAIHSSFW